MGFFVNDTLEFDDLKISKSGCYVTVHARVQSCQAPKVNPEDPDEEQKYCLSGTVFTYLEKGAERYVKRESVSTNVTVAQVSAADTTHWSLFYAHLKTLYTDITED